MEILRESLKIEADALRQRAEPIWAALEDLEDRERDQRAFESSLMHLEQQRLCITVMGEFNTGKSTLLNTFIGEELLPTDQLECTAVPTWVRWADDGSYEEHSQATVIYADGDSAPMPLSEVSAYTTLDWLKIPATNSIQNLKRRLRSLEYSLKQRSGGKRSKNALTAITSKKCWKFNKRPITKLRNAPSNCGATCSIS